jgi:hypothetical protein
MNRVELEACLLAYTSLAAARRTRGLGVADLIAHQQVRAELCELTGQDDIDRACTAARRTLGLPEPAAVDDAVAPKRVRKRGRRAGRYKNLADIVPGAAVPRTPDAVRVTHVVPTAIESDRRKH